MFPEVHTDVHHGIPTYWADLKGPLVGTLTFGVGTRDEPARLAGITHLVEHLVFRGSEPNVVVHDGETNEDVLTFNASGSPSDVADFLNGIARSIREFENTSSEALELEKSILAAEMEMYYLTPNAGLLMYRFGAQGPGMANFGGPSTKGLSRQEAFDWARTWLTADNAALSFTGEIPAGLDLRLPSGEAVRAAEAKPVIETPLLVESDKSGIAFSLLVEGRLSPFLAEAIQYEFHRRLRHSQGLIYSAATEFTTIDDDITQVDFVLDPTEATFIQTLTGSIAALREIAADGFSEDAITSARNSTETQFQWTDSLMGSYLDNLARIKVRGWSSPTPDEVLQLAASLDRNELTELLRASMPSLVVAFDSSGEPEETVLEGLGIPVDEFTVWSETGISGRAPKTSRESRWKASRSSIARGAELHVYADHGVLQVGPFVSRMEFADIEVLGHRECGCLEIVDSRGRTWPVDPRDWRGGDRLVAATIAKVAQEIIRPYPAHFHEDS